MHINFLLEKKGY